MNLNGYPVSDPLRHHLGIPADAEQVVIFSESSHWDPTWMLTSEEYFDRFVRYNLDQAIVELQKEPRRIYSIECIFFLRMYWERCPAERDNFRSLVNEGRLRLTSSGVTTADTLLPSAEAILRDLGPLDVQDGVVRVAMPWTAATIRLVSGPKKVTD